MVEDGLAAKTLVDVSSTSPINKLNSNFLEILNILTFHDIRGAAAMIPVDWSGWMTLMVQKLIRNLNSPVVFACGISGFEDSGYSMVTRKPGS